MNIIITMAGDGRRFKEIGIAQPKHMIVSRGKTLFEWSLLSLKNFFHEKFIFITRKEHDSLQFITRKCSELGIAYIAIKELDQLTGGQADTVLEAKSLIKDSHEPIMIYNIDTYVEPAGLKPTDIQGDGWVPAFEADGDRWSFVRFDKKFLVNAITEKERISDFGTIGLYYFKSFEMYEDCYRHFSFAEKKEKYIAPLYRVLIQNPKAAVYTKILPKNSVWVLGTPQDIVAFDPEFKVS